MAFICFSLILRQQAAIGDPKPAIFKAICLGFIGCYMVMSQNCFTFLVEIVTEGHVTQIEKMKDDVVEMLQQGGKNDAAFVNERLDEIEANHKKVMKGEDRGEN